MYKKKIIQWPEVESLVKELQQYEGIENVKKGRFFVGPGLAPTFQVFFLQYLNLNFFSFL